MKVLGFITLAALAIGGVGYFGGFAYGSAEVELTSKGRDTVNSGIVAAQDGLNSGLDRLKIDSASAVSVAVEAKE